MTKENPRKCFPPDKQIKNVALKGLLKMFLDKEDRLWCFKAQNYADFYPAYEDGIKNDI